MKTTKTNSRVSLETLVLAKKQQIIKQHPNAVDKTSFEYVFSEGEHYLTYRLYGQSITLRRKINY